MAYYEAGVAGYKSDLAAQASSMRAAFGADKGGFKEFLSSLEE